ncbi:hypothetical protein BKA70DRAFT_1103346 [Coprinopsis sp. MPI-PUGE-AT-0042]|nr:hypothetical protein BKA70DRAFT_1103346 [Coprinopsis sp. MPI-PUGE-AT-0042]
MSPKDHWKPSLSPTSGQGGFERPLGWNEQGFYWDSVFHRTADILRDAEIEVDPELTLSIDRITRPWTILKHRYPLLGARVEERSLNDIFFVVDPIRLLEASPGEIEVQTISDLNEVDQVVDRMHNGYSPLSHNLLACIRVLKRADDPTRIHVFIHSAHSISDEIAHHTLLREFLDLLASPASTLPPVSLMERLELASATETLHPGSTQSTARNRWRRAIGRVIIERRRQGLTGGHTLPRKWSPATVQTPAKSRVTSSTFTVEETERMMRACRSNGLTFGSVLPILGQIAMARSLSKCYLEGKMTQDEWEFRKREPMVNAGPLNSRPFLDPQWLKDGGATNVSLGIGYYFYQLPFIPLGAAANLRPGSALPHHFDMFSKGRFNFRCQKMKNNIKEFMQHPRFLEMNEAYMPIRLQRLRDVARKPKEGEPLPNMNPREQAAQGIVMNHGGATLGNLDTVLPHEYPSTDGARPTVKLLRVRSFLHCRPAELYLGASTFRKQMKFHIFWDGNVHEEEVVEDWLLELVEASKVYLTE